MPAREPSDVTDVVEASPFRDTREANRALNIAEFQRGAVHLQSLPLALFIELTQNCNLQCTYCRSAGKYVPNWNMPLELFQRVAAELFPSAALVDLRGWGESTILKHFTDYVDITVSYGPQIRLVTNAMNPDEHMWERLMAAHAMVVISCDTADPDLFTQLRGGGKVDQLRETVKILVKYREQYQVPADNVYFTAVVSQPSVSELPALIEMAHELGLPKVILFPVGIHPAHPWHLRHDLDGTRAGLIAAHDRANALGVTLQLGAALDDALRLVDDVKSLCMHPWAYALVDYEGRVGFCDHLLAHPELTFGSLREKRFSEIWNGPDFVALRTAHAQRNIPDRFSPCRWCYQMRYIDFEHLIYPSYTPKLVSNQTRSNLCSECTPITPVPQFAGPVLRRRQPDPK